MGLMEYFKVVLIIQLFYSVGFTMITHSIEANEIEYVEFFSGPTETVNPETIQGKIQTSVENQTNLPLVDIGSLVFFSGNLFIDLILNFVFAVPSMATILVTAILFIFNVDPFVANSIKIFAFLLISIGLFWALLAFITQTRSRGLV